MTRRTWIPLLLVVAWMAPAGLLAAQGGTEEESEPEAEHASQPSKLTIHGYLTQAYAQSEENVVLGIPERGTADYRTAALQIRYDADRRNAFVLQLDHERLGAGANPDLTDDVELDWVFYRRTLGESTSIKVGRVPMPFGVYNEIRDVGTLLPFYRPPGSFYADIPFGMETVDGVVATHTLGVEHPWSLETSLFYGDFTFVDPFEIENPQESRVEDAVGAQLWLETPIQGLRLGVGGQTFLVPFELEGQRGTIRHNAYHVSIDGSFDRFLTRAEYRTLYWDSREIEAEYWYVQLGYYVTPKLRVYVQAESADTLFDFGPPFGEFEFEVTDDVGVAVNYALRWDTLLKAEYHVHEGYDVFDEDLQMGDPPPQADYFIVSLSYAF